MARPLRLEFAGAVYHLTARGDRQEPIFLNDGDRRSFLDLLGQEVKQQGWICYGAPGSGRPGRSVAGAGIADTNDIEAVQVSEQMAVFLAAYEVKP